MDTGVTIRPNANVAAQGYVSASVASPDPATTEQRSAAVTTERPSASDTPEQSPAPPEQVRDQPEQSP